MATYAKEKGFTVQTLSTDTIASQVLGGTWSTGGTMNVSDSRQGTGTQTAAIIFGGQTVIANAETYDGSSFTEVGDLNTARGYHACGGTPTSAIATGGRTAPSSPNFTNIVEEFTAADFLIKTVTQS